MGQYVPGALKPPGDGAAIAGLDPKPALMVEPPNTELLYCGKSGWVGDKAAGGKVRVMDAGDGIMDG